MRLLLRRGHVGDRHGQRDAGAGAGIVAHGMLARRVLPVFAEAPQQVHHLRPGRLRGLHVAHHLEPFLLPRHPLGVARLGVLDHGKHRRADLLFLLAGEIAIDQPRIVHHLVEAGIDPLGRVGVQEFLAVLGVALGEFLLHAGNLAGCQRQQQVGHVGHGLLVGAARQLLGGVLEVLDHGRRHRLADLGLGLLQQARDLRQLGLAVPGEEARDGLARERLLGRGDIDVVVDPPVGQPVTLLVPEFHRAACAQRRSAEYHQNPPRPTIVKFGNSAALRRNRHVKIGAHCSRAALIAASPRLARVCGIPHRPGPGLQPSWAAKAANHPAGVFQNIFGHTHLGVSL
ncbi:hypothetical protein D3C81_916610 [compost metagenome]